MRTPSFDVKILVEKVRIIYMGIYGICRTLMVKLTVCPRATLQVWNLHVTFSANMHTNKSNRERTRECAVNSDRVFLPWQKCERENPRYFQLQSLCFQNEIRNLLSRTEEMLALHWHASEGNRYPQKVKLPPPNTAEKLSKVHKSITLRILPCFSWVLYWHKGKTFGKGNAFLCKENEQNDKSFCVMFNYLPKDSQMCQACALKNNLYPSDKHNWHPTGVTKPVFKQGQDLLCITPLG